MIPEKLNNRTHIIFNACVPDDMQGEIVRRYNGYERQHDELQMHKSISLAQTVEARQQQALIDKLVDVCEIALNFEEDEDSSANNRHIFEKLNATEDATLEKLPQKPTNELIEKIKKALADPDAPWYGSDLVSWVADLLDELPEVKHE